MNTKYAVARQVEREQQPAPVPVFGNMSDSSAFALARIESVDMRVLQPHLAAGRFLQSCKYLDQFRLTVSFDSRDSKRLAAAHLERHVIQYRIPLRAAKCEPAHTQHRVARFGVVFLYAQQNLAANHHPRKPLSSGLACWETSDHFAVAHNGDVVRQ